MGCRQKLAGLRPYPDRPINGQSDIDSHLRGLSQGADTYVGKPFDPFYLKAVIENLIANRRRIQQIILNLTSSTLTGEMREAVLDEADHAFLTDLHKRIDGHMADEAFNVQLLAREIGISYSSLYAKVKSLTGQAPLAFLMTYRMNVAMELLKSKRYTVSEVCYKMGASSLSSFSRSFKKQFGIPPSAV